MSGSKSAEEGLLDMPILEPCICFTLFEANLKPTSFNQKAFSCMTKDRVSHFKKFPGGVNFVRNICLPLQEKVNQIQMQVSITLMQLQKTPKVQDSGAKESFIAAETELRRYHFFFFLARWNSPKHCPRVSSTKFLDPPKQLTLHIDMFVLNSKKMTRKHITVVCHFWATPHSAWGRQTGKFSSSNGLLFIFAASVSQ